MTDYLGRLATRSLDIERVIQPRIPGLFEPISDGQFMEGLRNPEGFEPSVLSMTESRPMSSGPIRKSVPEGKVVGDDRLVNGEEIYNSQYGMKMTNENGTGNAPGVASLEADQISRRKYNIESPAGASVNASVVRPIGIMAQVYQRKQGNDFLNESNQDNAMLEDSDDRARSLDKELQTKPKAFDNASVRTLQGSHTNRPARAHAGPSPKMQDQLISASKAMPTIKVNIGRIEVRAVAEPSPQRPVSVKNPPKLSLEEYNKQRRGGRA